MTRQPEHFPIATLERLVTQEFFSHPDVDLPERRLEESFLVPPQKREEDVFRCNSDPESQTKAQARQVTNGKDALFMPLRSVVFQGINNASFPFQVTNGKDALFMPLRSVVFLFYSRKNYQSSNVCILLP
jgi:hypothetical protein